MDADQAAKSDPTSSQPTAPGKVRIVWTRPPAPRDAVAVDRILSQDEGEFGEPKPVPKVAGDVAIQGETGEAHVAAWLEYERAQKRSRQFGLKEFLAGTALACLLFGIGRGLMVLPFRHRELLLVAFAAAYLLSIGSYRRISRRWLAAVLAIDAFGLFLGIQHDAYFRSSTMGMAIVPAAVVAMVAAWLLVGRPAGQTARPVRRGWIHVGELNPARRRRPVRWLCKPCGPWRSRGVRRGGWRRGSGR